MAAPKNPANRWSEKAWRDAIRMAVNRQVGSKDKSKRLAALANKLVDAGLEGDVSALKEIGDRLDGKPSQAHTGPDGGPLVVNVVRFAGS